MATQTSSTLLAPKILVQKPGSGDEVECSVHTLPRTLLREFRHVFNDTYLRRPEAATEEDVDMDTPMEQQKLELLAIPTNQHAREDLVAIGDHIEREKDRLLNVVRLIFCIVCINTKCNVRAILGTKEGNVHTVKSPTVNISFHPTY